MSKTTESALSQASKATMARNPEIFHKRPQDGLGGMETPQTCQDASCVLKANPFTPFTKPTSSISSDFDKLNKTEKAFYAYLSARWPWVGIQAMTFKLGFDCRYTPDFITQFEGKITAWEVKGFWRDDAKVKIRVAARMFPFVDFVVVQKIKNDWKFTHTPK